MSRNLSEVIRLNRRQFLQGFAAVGATIANSTREATSAQIEKAWAELAANPWYFDVAGNIIIDPCVPEPMVRTDVSPSPTSIHGRLSA